METANISKRVERRTREKKTIARNINKTIKAFLSINFFLGVIVVVVVFGFFFRIRRWNCCCWFFRHRCCCCGRLRCRCCHRRRRCRCCHRRLRHRRLLGGSVTKCKNCLRLMKFSAGQQNVTINWHSTELKKAFISTWIVLSQLPDIWTALDLCHYPFAQVVENRSLHHVTLY